MVRKIFTATCALILFFGCGEFLRYILVEDNTFSRVMLHEMYTSDRNIDIAFVGSSHAYSSFVPKIMDEGFGAYTFVAGSAMQEIDGSFAMIQEICTYYRPERIFLELFHYIAIDSNFRERTNLTATYILSDYMRPSVRKYRFMLDASNPKHYANTFIPARRNWKKIFDFDFIDSVVRKKQETTYRNYQLIHKKGAEQYYVERGFLGHDKEVADNVYKNKFAYDKIPVTRLTKNDNNDWYQTLLKIIDYCKGQGVELTFVVAPLPEWTIVGMENYQDYYDYVKGIANEHGVEFYDFNLCNPKYFDANDRIMFRDEEHLNTVGAERLSEVFAAYFTGKITKDDLFYRTLREKLDAELPKVLGLAGLTKEGKGRVISNRDHGIEYRLEVIPKDGRPRVIKEYSEEKEFSIPKGEHGKLIMSWRMKSDEEEREGTKIELEY